MPAPASVAPVLVASKRSAADLRARSSSEATVIPIDARYCFFLRLSHKPSQKRRGSLAQTHASQSTRNYLVTNGMHAADEVAVFGTPP